MGSVGTFIIIDGIFIIVMSIISRMNLTRPDLTFFYMIVGFNDYSRWLTIYSTFTLIGIILSVFGAIFAIVGWAKFIQLDRGTMCSK